jgi:integrase/recombinase XerD
VNAQSNQFAVLASLVEHDAWCTNALDDSVPPAAALEGPAALQDETKLTDARTDAALLREYLQEAGLAAPTLESYRRELGRFLVYCQLIIRKSLTELKVADLKGYAEFLRDPPSDWVSTVKHPRRLVGEDGSVVPNPAWRPFSGPLSDPSRRLAVTVVKGFMAFAHKTGYLKRDPGALVKNVKTRRSARISRYLSPRAIELAFQAVASKALIATTEKSRWAAARDRALLSLFWHTGCRLSEITGASLKGLYLDDGGRWWLDVLGKGDKARSVPVPAELLHDLKVYLIIIGLGASLGKREDLPLIVSIRGKGKRSITDEAAAQALKRIFWEAADIAAATGETPTEEQLRQATPHFLRHGFLTFHANQGVPLKVLQQQAGHASIQTTGGYLHVEDGQRHDAITGSYRSKAR